MHQTIANATFQIRCEGSLGSGFSFMHKDIIVTNFHVVKNIIDLSTGWCSSYPIVVGEDGFEIKSKILDFDIENDIAILVINTPLPEGRVVLEPSDNFEISRGKRVIFSGFPHGLDDLLTSEAIISAPMDAEKFYLDGMVNKGNSGGPIVDIDSGRVIGIVTARRYRYEEEARKLQQSAGEILHIINGYPENVREISRNIDIGQFYKLMSSSLVLFTDMLSFNANSGIGIGFPISPAIELIERNYLQASGFNMKY
ncbi:trypsin-like peptidase domain-containing protein [Cronobacter turicensis]|nr:trypsin-like peptidase domain-containing protein [Cronobacter turicensis]ELY5932349.1 trypsin-like peptidase domain-containing protein [Cronobacter turicensis]